MKKAIIAGASAAVLAAMPVMGVFAEVINSTDVEDTVEVTVDASCTMVRGSGQNGTYTKTIANGADDTITGSTFTISCNDKSGGWKLLAIGSGDAEGNTAAMDASTVTADDIASTAAFDTDTSDWGFRVSGITGDGTDAQGYGIATGYNDFHAIPTGTAAKIASGAGATSTATVSTEYKVAISSTQAAGTYTGQVTYTVTHPAGN